MLTCTSPAVRRRPSRPGGPGLRGPNGVQVSVGPPAPAAPGRWAALRQPDKARVILGRRAPVTGRSVSMSLSGAPRPSRGGSLHVIPKSPALFAGHRHKPSTQVLGAAPILFPKDARPHSTRAAGRVGGADARVRPPTREFARGGRSQDSLPLRRRPTAGHEPQIRTQ